ncbi:MAG: hypothetical protein GY769_21500 [bacterium]|nr:hypothetical protein [bacterium]
MTSPENLERVAAGFRDQGVVFGWQMYLQHYESGAYVVFDSMAGFEAAISEATPGDRFTLYASALEARRPSLVARFDLARIPADGSASTPELEAIKSLVDQEDSEIVYVARSGSEPYVDYVCGAFDDVDWRDLIDEWRDLTGEILGFDEKCVFRRFRPPIPGQSDQ